MMKSSPQQVLEERMRIEEILLLEFAYAQQTFESGQAFISSSKQLWDKNPSTIKNPNELPRKRARGLLPWHNCFVAHSS